MHGIQGHKSHGTNHLSWRGWYARKHKARLEDQLSDILELPTPDHRAGAATHEAILLPQPAVAHKSEARAGDTIYLGSHQSVRAFTLSVLPRVEVGSDRVPLNSPIGRALLGRHLGDTIHLATLEGELPYTVLKII